MDMQSTRGAAFAWMFHRGLRELKRAYESSRSTADKEKADIEHYAAAQESPHFFGGLRLAEIPRQILRMSNHIAPTVS
jgi:hypothetical protein